jgi:hypothetical protein
VAGSRKESHLLLNTPLSLVNLVLSESTVARKSVKTGTKANHFPEVNRQGHLFCHLLLHCAEMPLLTMVGRRGKTYNTAREAVIGSSTRHGHPGI